ncbi:MAG: multiheme c-type cytochrome, partial [Novipirellula sp. JB048]
LVVVAGGYGEPTYQAQRIEGSKTRLVVTGNKGMYVGLVGLYRDAPMKYCRVALTDEFEDAKEMRSLMAEYQDQLRDLGLEGLGLRPIPTSSRRHFVGSEKCGECHTTAYEIWEYTPHFHATQSLVEPSERIDVARHFDPECLSCHVTGWNAQNYYPYTSGYLSLAATPHLTGNGCENCHGPGAEHAAAEAAGATISVKQRDRLREAMKLPLAKAKEKCMECHDLDNSPDFHLPNAFEEVYWPQIEHEGKD